MTISSMSEISSRLKRLLEEIRSGRISDLEFLDRTFETVIREGSESEVVQALAWMEDFLGEESRR